MSSHAFFGAYNFVGELCILLAEEKMKRIIKLLPLVLVLVLVLSFVACDKDEKKQTEKNVSDKVTFSEWKNAYNLSSLSGFKLKFSENEINETYAYGESGTIIYNNGSVKFTCTSDEDGATYTEFFETDNYYVETLMDLDLSWLEDVWCELEELNDLGYYSLFTYSDEIGAYTANMDIGVESVVNIWFDSGHIIKITINGTYDYYDGTRKLECAYEFKDLK